MKRVFKYVGVALIAFVGIFFMVGVFTPKISVGHSIKIDKPVEKVFTLFNDDTRKKEWITGLKKLELVSGDGSTGSHYRAVVDDNGEDFVITWQVTDFVQNDRVKLTIQTMGATEFDEFHFRSLGDKTELYGSMHFVGENLFWRSMYVFFEEALLEHARSDFAKFKHFVETQS